MKPRLRPELADLESWGFDVAGPLRDSLNRAVLAGIKTATSSRWTDDEGLSRVGDREILLDSAERPLAVIEITRVEIRRLEEIDLEVALNEGEGYETVADWRVVHEHYFLDELASEGHQPGMVLPDDTEILVEWFRVVKRLETDSDLIA